eukprot:gene10696-biopygen7589
MQQSFVVLQRDPTVLCPGIHPGGGGKAHSACPWCCWPGAPSGVAIAADKDASQWARAEGGAQVAMAVPPQFEEINPTGTPSALQGGMSKWS